MLKVDTKMIESGLDDVELLGAETDRDTGESAKASKEKENLKKMQQELLIPTLFISSVIGIGGADP